MTPDKAITGPDRREWRACKDGRQLFAVTGADAEKMVRAAARRAGAAVSYRDAEGPAEANGYRTYGPWIDAGRGKP